MAKDFLEEEAYQTGNPSEEISEIDLELVKDKATLQERTRIVNILLDNNQIDLASKILKG